MFYLFPQSSMKHLGSFPTWNIYTILPGQMFSPSSNMNLLQMKWRLINSLLTKTTPSPLNNYHSHQLVNRNINKIVPPIRESFYNLKNVWRTSVEDREATKHELPSRNKRIRRYRRFRYQVSLKIQNAEAHQWL